MFELSRLESVLGTIVLAVSEQGLCALEFAESDRGIRARLKRLHADAVFVEGPRAKATARQVEAYFAGDLEALGSLRVAPEGTEFQMRVWSALRDLPFGRSARRMATIPSRWWCRAIG